MRFSIGNDHAGVEYKEAIVAYLKREGHHVFNHGTDNNASVDYPDFIHPVAEDVSEQKADLGIIICGSGNGAAMTANNKISNTSSVNILLKIVISSALIPALLCNFNPLKGFGPPALYMNFFIAFVCLINGVVTEELIQQNNNTTILNVLIHYLINLGIFESKIRKSKSNFLLVCSEVSNFQP